MAKHLLSVIAFLVVSFAVQALSHFVINKQHFDSIGFARPDPIIPLGLLVMVVQGMILSLALTAWRGAQVSIADGVAVSATFGVFLVSYMALAAPAKYAVPSVLDWMVVEGVAGLIQFGIFGLLLGLVHRRFG